MRAVLFTTVVVIIALLFGGPRQAFAGAGMDQLTRTTIFKRADTDRNGKVTAAEHEARRTTWFKEMDKNGDGKLSPAEYRADVFKMTDGDGDAVIVLEEYLAYFVGDTKNVKRAPAAPGAKVEPGRTSHSERIDANGDGVHGKDEIVAFRETIFAEMDIDADCKVTIKEYDAHRAREFEASDTDDDGYLTVREILRYVFAGAK